MKFISRDLVFKDVIYHNKKEFKCNFAIIEENYKYRLGSGAINETIITTPLFDNVFSSIVELKDSLKFAINEYLDNPKNYKPHTRSDGEINTYYQQLEDEIIEISNNFKIIIRDVLEINGNNIKTESEIYWNPLCDEYNIEYDSQIEKLLEISGDNEVITNYLDDVYEHYIDVINNLK